MAKLSHGPKPGDEFVNERAEAMTQLLEAVNATEEQAARSCCRWSIESGAG